MNYEILYYHSDKTSETEQAVIRCLEPGGAVLSKAAAASDPADFAKLLSAALKRTRLLIVAAPEEDSKEGAASLIEKIVKPVKGKQTEKSQHTAAGFSSRLLQTDQQMILQLPCEPEVIPQLMTLWQEKLSKAFSLSFPEQTAPDTEQIAQQLDQQLPDAPRQRVAIGITAEKRYKSKLKTLEISIAVLLVLAALQLGAAAWLFISQM